MTTKTTKIADRYAALVAVASNDGIVFEIAKRPTSKDCEALGVLIDSHRAGLSFKSSDEIVATMDTLAATYDEAFARGVADPLVAALETLDALDGGTSARVLRKDSAEDRAAAIEAKRADARRRFESATKATTAHGYALIAAATADGDRMENLRAKLAELPVAVRAGACRLAAEKLVQPGSTMQTDLRALYDEQPKQERAKAGGVKRSLADETAVRKNGYAHIFVGEGVDATFSVVRTIVNGKIVFTLTQH